MINWNMCDRRNEEEKENNNMNIFHELIKPDFQNSLRKTQR
jgi:hypothetical protein